MSKDSGNPKVTIRLTPEELAWVDQMAAKEGLGRAEWFRKMAGLSDVRKGRGVKPKPKK